MNQIHRKNKIPYLLNQGSNDNIIFSQTFFKKKIIKNAIKILILNNKNFKKFY